MGENSLRKSETPRQVIHRGRGARNSLSNDRPRRGHLAACRFGHVDKCWDPGAKNGIERGKTGQRHWRRCVRKRQGYRGRGKATEGEGAARSQSCRQASWSARSSSRQGTANVRPLPEMALWPLGPRESSCRRWRAGGRQRVDSCPNLWSSQALGRTSVSWLVDSSI
jgi:hypothetical protein